MRATIKRIIGHILLTIFPNRAKALSEKGITLNFNLNRMERLMKNAIIHTSEKNQDFDHLAELHKKNWIHQGQYFFEHTEDRFRNDFLPNASFIFDILKSKLTTSEHDFDVLVEIGTGNGRVLDYLSAKFPDIQRMIGLDLSEEQIKINKMRYTENTRLEFVASDVFEWVQKPVETNIIFVTYGGVLEYFTEKRLRDFLSYIRGLGKVLFVAIEPYAKHHDFSLNPQSQLYGIERSFSHNYPRLFKETGFNIWHESRKEILNYDCYFSFIGAES